MDDSLGGFLFISQSKVQKKLNEIFFLVMNCPKPTSNSISHLKFHNHSSCFSIFSPKKNSLLISARHKHPRKSLFFTIQFFFPTNKQKRRRKGFSILFPSFLPLFNSFFFHFSFTILQTKQSMGLGCIQRYETNHKARDYGS